MLVLKEERNKVTKYIMRRELTRRDQYFDMLVKSGHEGRELLKLGTTKNTKNG